MNYYPYQSPPPIFPGQFMPQQAVQPVQQPQPQQYQPQMERLAQLQYEAQLRDQQAAQNNMANSGARLINVGSIEEAKGFLSPSDGSRVYFINSANGDIYSKQLDFNTGKSNFFTYKRQEEETKEENPQTGTVNFVNIDDFNSLKKEYEKTKEELTKLKKKVLNLKKVEEPEEDDE